VKGCGQEGCEGERGNVPRSTGGRGGGLELLELSGAGKNKQWGEEGCYGSLAGRWESEVE